jgi:adenosylhomocysteine nucleosidase
MIGIITALDIELSLFEKNLFDKKECVLYGLKFLSGTISSTPVTLVKSGIGKVNAAFAATLLIEKFAPSFVIMTGVAGGIKDLNVLDTVVASAVVQHDCDQTVTGEFPKGFINELNVVEIKCHQKVNEIILSNSCAKLGIIATGDQFIACNETAMRIHSEFNAIAVEMEGGAVGQVATLANVPFTVIRVISDGGDNEAAETFEVFAKKAAEQNSELVIKILPKIAEAIDN